MKKVRFAVVGVGAMGKRHAESLLRGEIPSAKLVAVCDQHLDSENAWGLPVLRSFDELVRSGLVEGVVIATPHASHTKLAIAALGANLHAFVEKPIALHLAQARRILAARDATQRPQPLLGVNLTLRGDARQRALSEFLARGELGKIARVTWIVTDRFRPDAYFREAPWRGTFQGSGGGILINQCLHHLDQLVVWFGSPLWVQGFCTRRRTHPIEVEDEVTLHFELPGGVRGTFMASSAESPGTDRLEIAGERGLLVVEGGHAVVRRIEPELSVLRGEGGLGMRPGVSSEPLALPEGGRGSITLLENFAAAALGAVPLEVTAEDALPALEFVNAAMLSSIRNRPVQLPLDAHEYEAVFDGLGA